MRSRFLEATALHEWSHIVLVRTCIGHMACRIRMHLAGAQSKCKASNLNGHGADPSIVQAAMTGTTVVPQGYHAYEGKSSSGLVHELTYTREALLVGSSGIRTCLIRPNRWPNCWETEPK